MKKTVKEFICYYCQGMFPEKMRCVSSIRGAQIDVCRECAEYIDQYSVPNCTLDEEFEERLLQVRRES